MHIIQNKIIYAIAPSQVLDIILIISTFRNISTPIFMISLENTGILGEWGCGIRGDDTTITIHGRLLGHYLRPPEHW